MMMMMMMIKLPKFTRPLYGVGEHNTKIFFFFFLAFALIVSAHPY